MVWFQCEACGDSLKKPKLAAHMHQCRTEAFTCIDCSVTFDLNSVQGHTSCVTEHEKYALLATKPGGGGAATAAAAGAAAGVLVGAQFLATRPPWLCSCCGVTCTSAETLAGHAGGKKHRSKARAAESPAAPPAAAAEPQAEQPPAKRPREEGEEGEEAAPGRVKWRRLAAEVLRAAPGRRMAADALKKAVLAVVAEKHGSAAGDAAALRAGYAAEVAGSKRFRADAAGMVTLREGL